MPGLGVGLGRLRCPGCCGGTCEYCTGETMPDTVSWVSSGFALGAIPDHPNCDDCPAANGSFTLDAIGSCEYEYVISECGVDVSADALVVRVRFGEGNALGAEFPLGRWMWARVMLTGAVGTPGAIHAATYVSVIFDIGSDPCLGEYEAGVGTIADTLQCENSSGELLINV